MKPDKTYLLLDERRIKMFEKIYKQVRIFYIEGAWHCYFEDYKEARIKQNKKWSEKSFVIGVMIII